jgi:hypothetical protein
VEPSIYRQAGHPLPAPLAVRSAHVASDEDRSDWLGVPAITWLLVIFALLVLGGGFTAMAVFSSSVDAGAIAALVTAVLGVVATHIGHMAGQRQALDVLRATGQAGGVGRGGGAE